MVLDSSTSTIVRELPLRIERAEVIRFLEYPEGRQPPLRIQALLDELLPVARRLADARGCFRALPVEQAGAVGLEPIEAEVLVLGLVTAGSAIEQRAQEHSDAGQLTRALVFDAAGSAAAEEAADRLSALIASPAPASAPGHHARPAPAPERVAIPCRLSPGYGGWPVTCQPSLFSRLPHAELQIALKPSCLMVPQKSISFALWLGAEGPVGKGLAGCSRCDLQHCRYRRQRTRAVRPSLSPACTETRP